MTSPISIIRLAGAALALVAAGCGGGSGPRASAANAPTKAAFIKRADAICKDADAKQKKGQIAFSERHRGNVTKQVEEQVALAAGLPPVREEAEGIGKLTPPSGDEAKIEAIVEGLEEAVTKAEAEPSLLLKNSSGPFTKVFKLTREYGFGACATPL